MAVSSFFFLFFPSKPHVDFDLSCKKKGGLMSFLFLDFEKTFIQCIVYNYDVLKEYGNEADVKAAGKVLTKGKDYVVEDGDIILIKAGAAKS